MRQRGEVDGRSIVSVAIIAVVCAAVGGLVFGAFMRSASAQEEQDKLDQTATFPTEQSRQPLYEWDPTPENIEQIQRREFRSTYMGLSEHDLLSDFGSPRSAIKNDDGKRIWFYQWSDSWAEFTIAPNGYIVRQRLESGVRD